MIVSILLGVGSLFVAIGTLGIVRLRDVYSRLQASGVSDNVGFTLILVGLIVHGGFELRDWTLLFLLFLVLATNPIATHSIAKSAFTQQHRGDS